MTKSTGYLDPGRAPFAALAAWHWPAAWHWVAGGWAQRADRLLRALQRLYDRQGVEQSVHGVVLTAAAVFLGSAVYYGLCLFPGLGGELNAGDSAKFQILGHTPILLHGPGYPLVQALGALLRTLALPVPEWWAMAFALSALPGSLANALAYVIVQRLTRNAVVGLAGALLLGSAGLMAVQATEAEVYALALAFILSVVLLLLLFVQTRRLGFFLAACAVYALSFGNHLMMIMLLPMFVLLTFAYRRMILRPRPVAAILLFVFLGASQYLYLAHLAYSPETAYSEYMPLPPEPAELVRYILGTYFSDMYGSGLASTQTLEALVSTLTTAHPWISLPMMATGFLLFVAGWRYRDAGWFGLAAVFGATFCFVPFMLWYGAYDIRAFHLPVLGTAMVATVAAIGWWLRRHPAVCAVAAVLLLATGVVRAGHTAMLLGDREPLFTGLQPAIREIIAQSPVERPLVAMAYGVRMATLYYYLKGEVPQSPVYRTWWRAVPEIGDQREIGGIVVPTDGYQFVRWVEHQRPDMSCRTEKIAQSAGTRWPAYSFRCVGDRARTVATGGASAPESTDGR